MNSNLGFRLAPKALSLFYKFFLGKYIDEKYIMPLYVDAHYKYSKEKSIGKYWIEVYEGLEVSLEMSTRFCESVSKIAVRNKSDQVLEEVTLIVEAEGYFDGNFKDEYFTVQQRLVFYNVGSSPKIKNLSDIPRVDYWAVEDGTIIPSYRNLSISIISLYREGKTEDIHKKKKLLSCCQSNYLNDLSKGYWQEKSGRYYNIGYIHKAKNDLMSAIYADINLPHHYVTKEEYLQINVFQRRYWELSSFINKIHSYLILRKSIVSARFWILVALGRQYEDQNGRLKFNNFWLIKNLL